MHEKFLQPYNPKDTEDRIYTLWEESGMFNPDHAVRMGVTDPKAEAFSIVLPPPNVTGQLHLGHAGMLTIEDIMVRFHRMDGKKTLWIPGTDHAAIATQSKVEKLLAKDNIRRHDLGRDAFLEHVQAFAHASQETILHQVKKMGASIDWSRLAFTLDDEREKAVHTAFIRMYHDGLIYQKERIVNWDPKGQTVISDDEVVHEERAGMMYTFKYSADFPIAIATTRPETKLGDTGVAVHPNDPRYQAYIGKTYTCTFAGQELEIRIVADEAVDPEFGTGAVGLTPAHSMTDWEIAERHDLPMKKVINEYAKMTVGMEGVLGQKTTVAREAIVAWIREQGLLEKEESITQNISTAERTGGIIEPLPKMQWWIDTEKKIIIPHNTIPGLDPQTPYSLKEVMLHVVQSGATNILPDRFEKVYYHWIEKLRPWNISRQIWYGHRIPVWYTKEGAPVLPKEQKLVFMRHGQSEYNVAGKIQGQYNAPLTETGREQARTAAASLVGTSFSKIICSDLDRAHETANIIAKELGLSVEVWPELREIDAGTLSGAPHHETLDTLAYVIQSGTGETLAELEARARIVVEKIKNMNTSEDILFVGHSTFTSLVFAVWHNIPAQDFLAKHGVWELSHTETEQIIRLHYPTDETLTQDEDTLDTWFSSGLWTFSTMGWPDSSQDLKEFHPTSVLETGYDIIFFWVARMILMTTYLLGTVPFKTVYFHGLVRDEQGRKISKSLGNNIDPLELINDYGADAVRMALIIGTGPGQDSKIGENKIKAYKKFANKLWNISRFILEQTHEVAYIPDYTYHADDQKLLDAQRALITEITEEMRNYKYYLVGEKLYHYMWHTLADDIIEDSKAIFAADDTQKKLSRQQFLIHTLSTCLKTLHPFMPYITEEIWQLIPDHHKDNSHMLMVQAWPQK